MLRFLFQRLLFMVAVSFSIVYAIQFGILWVQRAQELEPSTTITQVFVNTASETRQFFGNAFQGDFGQYETISGAREVKELLLQSFPASLGLLLASLLASIAIGIPLGIWVAIKRNSGITFSVLLTTLLGISVPSFFLAMLLQQSVIYYYVAYERRVLSVAGFGWDIEHMLLPMIVLSVRPVAYLMRTAHIAMQRALQEDYVRTAHAKGLRPAWVINVHVLRNVAVSLITAIGISLHFLLAVLPIVEYIFGWPGLGLRLLQGITNTEAKLAMTFALALGLLLMVGNLLLDLAYRLVDPRLREAG
ncbi:MAG: ABC transporter permease [Anaerolineales bacterium]